ncbi:energy-coupling factor transporter transmembrane protein EcfT [Lacrimispora sp. NSJ-141]|uniref:Energy-coupling factor transporter transmembrane protein EcfT n=1 Tax=Lientehia hominis TaxID=2897778 RepID=A0AAP2W887_9FIRM|nr:energy-coupling factor transporter transmembrane component T [Lientehia hominis]MCD2491890.1 energy-coupling factor transporter transmembrane protein EcfT [Lientehia hominis]
MMRDITLGQYYPVQSPVHKLDPRTKLFGTLVLIAALFAADNLFCYILAAVFLFGTIRLSRVPVKHIVKGLKPVIFLLLFSVVFNLFLTSGEVLVQFWVFKITREGLSRSGMMAVRLIFLVMGTSLLTFTTTPNQLTDGLERSLRFLKVVRVPVHEIAMMMSIALRFIPILVEETDKIMKAQMARGADFESGGLIKKAKAMIPLLVPLFISAFRRASDLAMAMEARCYHGGEGRTKMKPLRYAAGDRAAYLVLLGFLLCIILLKIFL